MAAAVDVPPPPPQEPACAVAEVGQTGPIVVCEGPGGLFALSWMTPSGRVATVLVRAEQITDVLETIAGKRA